LGSLVSVPNGQPRKCSQKSGHGFTRIENSLGAMEAVAFPSGVGSTVVTSRLRSSSRVRNEIEPESLVGGAGGRNLLCNSSVRGVWPRLGYRIRLQPLKSWREIITLRTPQ